MKMKLSSMLTLRENSTRMLVSQTVLVFFLGGGGGGRNSVIDVRYQHVLALWYHSL